MATLIVYALYLVQVLFFTKKLFGISFDSAIWKLLVLLNIPVIISVLIKLMLPILYGYIGGSVILLCTSAYALNKLNQKMGLNVYIQSKLNKRK